MVQGTTYATANYVIEGGISTQRVAAGRPAVLPVTKLVASGGPMRAIALVFPLLRQPARCVQRVELRLRLLGGRGKEATLAVYPSARLSLAAGRRPASASDSLIDNRPRGVAEVPLGAPWAVVDISELYRTWARGGPFPSEHAEIPAGTPLVVIVRPPAYDDPTLGGAPDFARSFAAVGNGRTDRPQLRWTAKARCRP
jgi:hypothetical protein